MKHIEVTDLNDPALAVYSKLNEVQLKRYYEPEEGLFICESPKVIRRALDAGYQPVSLLLEPKYLEGEDADIAERISSDPEVPVYSAPLEILSKLTGYFLTGGMLCAMRRKPLASVEELLGRISKKRSEAAGINSAESSGDPIAAHAPAVPNNKRTRIAVLEDIENPTNVGAIFRSAAALGIDAVLLTGGCSDPLYRRAARVSVGNIFQIPWTWISEETETKEPNLETKETDLQKPNATAEETVAQFHYIDLLHRLGFKTAALALTEKTISIDDPVLKADEKLAIILGNEGNGLLPETISKSDYAVKIPMPEGIDSLNVAAASAVAFWELRC